MAIVLSKEPVRYTPAHYGEKAGSPVYLVQPATRRQRAQFRAKALEQGLKLPTDTERLAALRSGAQQVIVSDELPEVNDILDRLQALANLPADDEAGRKALALSDDDGEKLRLLELALNNAIYKPYTQLNAAREMWDALAPVIAAQMFLTGWENVEAEFKRENGMVPEAVLDALPETDVLMIGWHALQLFQPTKDEEKNSESPQQSPSSQLPTTAA